MIPDFCQASWTKSTRSQQTTDQCVELAGASGYVAVRDSKDPDGFKLVFTGQAWRRFSRQIKAGAFDPS
ncbi:DUF397 domain-containing protein [Actinomadura sp. NAK00032]|uniref:DUF397 domain-containing protein n=1 Tax=Actinomadura sp. NAK00032 TaxID=2742128 RepID=UPI0015904582|nr:DUF397 domain-containing protein [Actinomadura sp. NAK00032]QKW39954.1 DUF397 domain-containing protein [Actinomadura sp. NAK00032]